MQEIWKDIEGYEGYYQVSNLGRVRGLDRYVTRSDGVTQFKRGGIKQPKNSTDGYWLVTLNKNGHSKTCGVHILVAKAFLKNPNNLPEVNHKDFNRKNNVVWNLEYSTHQDNIRYSADNGRYKIRDFNGEKNPNYGNHVLHDYYAEYPEKAVELLGRPGSQNGHAKPILMYKDGRLIKRFKYVGECVKYLMENNLIRGKDVTCVRDRIRKTTNEGKTYYGYTFVYE